MNWEAIAAIAQLVGTIGVIITLVFLAVQVRGNTRVANAQASQSISEFVLRIAIFRAEHADRFAKLESSSELTEGTISFGIGAISNFCCMPRRIFIIAR